MKPVFQKSKLQQSIRLLQKQFEQPGTPKALILMYHRICEKSFDPFSLSVIPKHFQEHLDVLKKYTQPISLQQLVESYQNGKIPDRSVVVTFDDGYADNLYNAAPLLEQYNIPATVFVQTGFLGSNQNAWDAELAWLLLHPSQLPEHLNLSVSGHQLTWNLGQAAYYNEANYQQDGGNVDWKPNSKSRLSLFYSIWQLMRPLSANEQRKILSEIQTWANPEINIPVLHRPLDLEELQTLSQREVIDIGAHTVNHRRLSKHSVNIQQEEILQSKVDLEKWLKRSINTFAYPFGDYTLKTSRLVQETGFICACSTVEDVIHKGCDVFQLPRFNVKDWNRQQFEEQLSRWFNESPVKVIGTKITRKLVHNSYF
jgi:peptidoglycan/xylan/chitin deacetylase (PgdA/CDA1 family)